MTIYEIFPQTEAPLLSKIAHLDYDNSICLQAGVLLGEITVVWYGYYPDGIHFMIWDYRLQHSIMFFAHVEYEDVDRLPEVRF